MATANGGCLCGKVRFAAAGKPKWVAHCHCHSCRRHTASPVATFVGFDRPQVTFASPDRAIFSSSPGVWRSFCDRCGTPIAYEAESAPGEIHLYLGTFDSPEQFHPERHVFHAERLTSFEIHDTLPRHAAGGSEPPTSHGPSR
jgi:hypothetical protein